MLTCIFYHLGGFFSRILPGPVRRGIAWCIGQGYWSLRPGLRRTVEENLRVVHGGAIGGRALRRRARRVVMNFARSIQIFLELPWLDWQDILSRSDFSQLDRALEEAGRPRAFILATGHIGPWELGGYCLAQRGFGAHTVALDHPNRGVAAFYSGRRRLLGIHAHPMRGSFGALRSAIDRGEAVALAIDRAYAPSRHRYRMFGVESDFPLGHLILAMRCNVPVLTGALVFDGSESLRYVHGATYTVHRGGDTRGRIDDLQRACLRDLEGIIRNHSDQWFHFEPLKRSGGNRP